MQANRPPKGYHVFSNPNVNVGLRRSLHVQSDEASASSYERAQLFTGHSSNVNNTADGNLHSFFASQRIYNMSGTNGGHANINNPAFT